MIIKMLLFETTTQFYHFQSSIGYSMDFVEITAILKHKSKTGSDFNMAKNFMNPGLVINHHLSLY